MNIKFPLLIDAGLSTEMERMGYNLNHKLWTSHYLESDPEALLTVHLSYLNAGAKCITTFSYQATLQGYADLGYNHDEAKRFILSSVEIASNAVARYCNENPGTQRPLIAGSIGPYGAYLADGSEYMGHYPISDKELKAFHIDKIDLLDHSNVDILAFETIPSFREARIISELSITNKKPSWVSFSCIDGKHISDGTPIADCAKMFENHPTVFAVGVNCTQPINISSLISEIRSVNQSIRIIVYPNSGEVYDGVTKDWKGLKDSDALQSMVKTWHINGADIIGGCCRLGAEDTYRMSKALNPI